MKAEPNQLIPLKHIENLLELLIVVDEFGDKLRLKAKPVPIAMESDGMDLDMLEDKLKLLPDVKLSPRRPFRAAAYVVPTHHNPTGCCYSPGMYPTHQMTAVVSSGN